MTRETWGGWDRCDHGVWLTLATLISASALSIPGVGHLLFGAEPDALGAISGAHV